MMDDGLWHTGGITPTQSVMDWILLFFSSFLLYLECEEVLGDCDITTAIFVSINITAGCLKGPA